MAIDVVSAGPRQYVLATTSAGQPFYVEVESKQNLSLPTAKFTPTASPQPRSIKSVVGTTCKTTPKSSIVGHCMLEGDHLCTASRSGAVSNFEMVAVPEGEYGRLSGSMIPHPIISEAELRADPAKITAEVATETKELTEAIAQGVKNDVQTIRDEYAVLGSQLQQLSKKTLPYFSNLAKVVETNVATTTRLSQLPPTEQNVATYHSVYKNGAVASYRLGRVVEALTELEHAKEKLTKVIAIFESIQQKLSQIE